MKILISLKKKLQKLRLFSLSIGYWAKMDFQTGKSFMRVFG